MTWVATVLSRPTPAATSTMTTCPNESPGRIGLSSVMARSSMTELRRNLLRFVGNMPRTLI
ncbi:hypothetical protein D3C77_721450 [compost metagenome]